MKLVHLEIEEIQFGDATIKIQRARTNRVTHDQQQALTHAHDYYELHLVKRGSYVFTINEKLVTAESGSLIILDPGCTHKMVMPEAETEIISLGLHIIKEEEPRNFYDYLISCLQRNVRVPLMLEKPLINKLVNYYHAPARKSVHQLFHRKLEACEILTLLFEMLASDTDIEEEVYGNSFDMLLDVLVNDPKYTLREIAQQLGYSERQMNRKIHARYGVGLREFRKGLKKQ